jgi:hypothetical protein
MMESVVAFTLNLALLVVVLRYTRQWGVATPACRRRRWSCRPLRLTSSASSRLPL